MRAAAFLFVAIIVLFSMILCPTAMANVMISELCDPYSNYLTDRFLEIYNPDADTIDLTGWSLVAIANGVTAFTWNLSGQIIPGQALVAGCRNTVTVFPVTFADDGWSTSNGNWNGKVGDGAKLLAPGGILVDYVVVTGTTFENSDYVRKPEILAPSTTYNPAEWTSTPVTLATNASPGNTQRRPARAGTGHLEHRHRSSGPAGHFGCDRLRGRGRRDVPDSVRDRPVGALRRGSVERDPDGREFGKSLRDDRRDPSPSGGRDGLLQGPRNEQPAGHEPLRAAELFLAVRADDRRDAGRRRLIAL